MEMGSKEDETLIQIDGKDYWLWTQKNS